MIQFRDYQQTLKNDVYSSWNGGNKNVLMRLDTGGGKSVVVSDIVNDDYKAGHRHLVMAHRNELVVQMSCHVASRGIPHKIVGSSGTIAQARREHRAKFGDTLVDPNARTAVVGVDTMVRRDPADFVNFSKWTVDEAHHVLRDNKWGKAISMMPNALGLGVSATIIRADGKGLGRSFDGVFDDLVSGPNMRYLIENNFLSDYEIVCPRSDLQVSDNDKSAGGDWSNKTLRKAAKKSQIVGNTVDNYLKYANGRRAIVFATDVETANEMGSDFNARGVRAASLSAKTPPAVREKFIKEFREGVLNVLINVDLFDEGFDVPACDVVILARPTASLGKYRQMVGRALRYVDGKTALIIDQVSNVVRHGLPDRQIAWTLARRDKRGKSEPDPDEIPTEVCTECSRPYEKFRTACPHCGAIKPLPAPRSRSLEMVEGDLILLDKAALNAMRVATVLESAADVGERVAHAAGPIAGKAAVNRQADKIKEHGLLTAAINQWAGVERHRGFTDSEIQKKFYLTLGVDVLTALDSKKPASEIKQLRETVERWYMK